MEVARGDGGPPRRRRVALTFCARPSLKAAASRPRPATDRRGGSQAPRVALARGGRPKARPSRRRRLPRGRARRRRRSGRPPRHSARATTPGAFPSARRRVDRPSPVTTRSQRGQLLVEPDEVEERVGAGNELRPERGERGAETSRGARARELGEGQSSSIAASRSSSRLTARGLAPFCGPKRRGASASVVRTSQRTVVGTGSRLTTSRRPAPPSTVALPPRPTRSAAGAARSAASTSSPNPRLDATSGSRSRAARRGRPIAAAASTTARPSGSSSQRAEPAGRADPRRPRSASRRRAPPPVPRRFPRPRRRRGARSPPPRRCGLRVRARQRRRARRGLP